MTTKPRKLSRPFTCSLCQCNSVYCECPLGPLLPLSEDALDLLERRLEGDD
jgi:hypothetical protein